MYQVGELIFYGDTGVCEITEIAHRFLPGITDSRLYYTMKPVHQECVIYTPVDTKVFMRPILTREEAEQLIDMIPAIQAQAFHSRVLSQLTEHYKQSLKSHDCLDLLELTMSIYAKKQALEEQNRKFGTVDEKFMRRAEDLLYSELSASLGMPREEVPSYIASRIGPWNEEGGAPVE